MTPNTHALLVNVRERGVANVDEVRVEIDGQPAQVMTEGPDDKYGLEFTPDRCQSVIEYQYTVKFGPLRNITRAPRSGAFRRPILGVPEDCALLGTTGAHTFVVTSTVDAVDQTPGDGICDALIPGSTEPVCTLRAAVMEANATPEADVILLENKRYRLTLRANEEGVTADAYYGDLDITQPVTIRGPAKEEGGRLTNASIMRALNTDDPTDTTAVSEFLRDDEDKDDFIAKIDAGENSRIFEITTPRSADGLVSLGHMMLTGGRVTDEPGGAILNQGSLALRGVALVENTTYGGLEAGGGAINHGGAIFNSGSLIATETAFIWNWAWKGGAIMNDYDADATITRSLFTRNAGRAGSAIANRRDATMTIEATSIVQNRPDVAPQIVRNEGDMTLRFVTIARNTYATPGAGVALSSYGRTRVQNSHFQANEIDCSGNITSLGGNVFHTLGGRPSSNNTCTIDALGTDLTLSDVATLNSTLVDLGGFTPMLPMGLGRLDALPASASGCRTGMSQRGYTRPIDSDGDGVAGCEPGAQEKTP